ncbi:MAG: 1,2-phenylacetyl-CoA epoxidase subunit PaaC [Chitinophagaceae bacterium]
MNDQTSFLLHLADNALILGHRNSEWCGHGPVLEQDIAITNISLDLIGQARNFYQYAAQLINETQKIVAPNEEVVGGEVTEDSLAYLREAKDFKNCLLLELPKGDWAVTILRQFFFSNYQYFLYGQLQNSRDEQVAAIAAKALKEVTYHLRWSSEWVIRLGDGTEESHLRIVKAVDELWPYTGELFMKAGYEENSGVDLSTLRNEWMNKVKDIFEEATLPFPAEDGSVLRAGGKEGRHTEHLDNILIDLQYLQRAYPNSEW